MLACRSANLNETMKKVAWILAAIFGLAFIGATLMNADLISKSRRALASGVLRNKSSLGSARYHLVVVIPDLDDSFFRGLLDGIEESAPSAGAVVQVFRYSSSSPAESERFFEVALRAKVDGVIMYTPRNDAVIRRVQKATQSGTVFIPVGTDVPTENPDGFIGSGSLLQGFEGGKRICGELGASARIGVILPASGSEGLRDEPLYRGVASAIKPFPGATIVSVIPARSDVLSGEEAASALLHTNPSVNALFCTNSRDTIGAAQVVVDLNQVGQVLIIGADETPEIRHYIDNGVIMASIVRDSRRIGQEAVQAFTRHKEGRPPIQALEVGFVVKTQVGVVR